MRNQINHHTVKELIEKLSKLDENTVIAYDIWLTEDVCNHDRSLTDDQAKDVLSTAMVMKGQDGITVDMLVTAIRLVKICAS